MGMFVAIVSGTVVATSLPRIIADLGGGQSAYTWVVTASLLAMTVTTPIWGKFADLFDRKTLVQVSLVIFVLGSMLAGLSESAGMMIGFRVLQGVGVGGLTALVQIVIADLISPRERGRYAGIMGSIMAVGSAGGPLLGGLVTDSIGWRWNFYIMVPFALIAIVVLQRTLHLPKRQRAAVSIDYLGATLIAAAVSLLLIWVSLAGGQFAWVSVTSTLMLGGTVVLAMLAVRVERRASEPMIPLTLFRNRTVLFSILASISVGIAMFGVSVFLSQYMQLARGRTPTESGLLTLPLVAGSLVASTWFGLRISRTGRWKPVVVGGSFALLAGLAAMGTIRADTNLVLLAVYMAAVGTGMGMLLQNLVLVTQNAVPASQLGTASASVSFFRSLGGVVGVGVMGALLASRVGTLTTDGLNRIGAPSSGGASGEIPVLSELSAPVRGVVEAAYGQAIGEVFLVIVPLAILTVVMVLLLPDRPLGTRTAVEELAEEQAAARSAAPLAASPRGTPLVPVASGARR
jgi:EmrB/QacA subfamily drug resistance transporter